MKPYILSAAVTKKSDGRMIAASLLSISLLSGCQKQPDTSADIETQNTAIVSELNEPQDTVEPIVEDKNAAEPMAETEVDLANIENNHEKMSASASMNSAHNEAASVDPEQAVTGTQITDVRYRSAAGDTLSVVFETSATGILNAIISLPNQPKMTLSAPEGQGNNPTYRSTDGSMELVSHGGGGAIDLLQNGQLTSFEAISAEAEVVTQP